MYNLTFWACVVLIMGMIIFIVANPDFAFAISIGRRMG